MNTDLQDKGDGPASYGDTSNGGLGRIVSLDEIIGILLRAWKGIIFCTVLATVSAALLILLEGRTYVAQTSMLVKLGRERFSALQVAPLESPNAVFSDRPESVNNEIEILRDPSLTTAVFPALKARLQVAPQPTGGVRLVKQVLSALKSSIATLKEPLYDLGLMKRITADQALLLQFYKAFHVSTIKQTDMLTLAFEWDNPDFAAFALRQYTEAYRVRHIEVHGQKNGLEIYRAEVETARKAVEESEEALIGFQRQMAASPDFQYEIIVNEVMALEQERGQLQVNIDELDLRKQALAADTGLGRQLDSDTSVSCDTHAHRA